MGTRGCAATATLAVAQPRVIIRLMAASTGGSVTSPRPGRRLAPEPGA